MEIAIAPPNERVGFTRAFAPLVTYCRFVCCGRDRASGAANGVLACR